MWGGVVLVTATFATAPAVEVAVGVVESSRGHDPFEPREGPPRRRANPASVAEALVREDLQAVELFDRLELRVQDLLFGAEDPHPGPVSQGSPDSHVVLLPDQLPELVSILDLLDPHCRTPSARYNCQLRYLLVLHQHLRIH